jgi:hypothetical protein
LALKRDPLLIRSPFNVALVDIPPLAAVVERQA